MKQLIIFCGIILLMSGCKENDKKEDTPAVAGTGNNVQTSLPFELAKPYRNWQPGSHENVVVAMSALKSFVDKDFEGLANTLGDSLDIALDNYHEKLSRDSAVAIFKPVRSSMNDLVITMYDYESVISEDKTEEWVTLWYKQAWKDETGKADSLNIIDDCKMLNGKMIELDEKIQHFPAKKS